MELASAISLIQHGIVKTAQPQIWADLGAGKGLFTNALSTQLASGSTIFAIDKSARELQHISIADTILLEKVVADFLKVELNMAILEGVIMANTLHFVKDASAFLIKVRKRIKPSGRIIIVEYEMTTPNQWVPYPIGFDKIKILAKQTGFAAPSRLAETPSVFNNRKIYSALLMRKED